VARTVLKRRQIADVQLRRGTGNVPSPPAVESAPCVKLARKWSEPVEKSPVSRRQRSGQTAASVTVSEVSIAERSATCSS
jgi:hypothetical protein